MLISFYMASTILTLLNPVWKNNKKHGNGVQAGLTNRALHSSQKGVSMTVTFLSFLAEAVFRHGVYHLILDTLLNGPSTASSLTSSSNSRASNLLHRGTWEIEIDRDEICL